jgi:hypothetical protein
MIYTKGGGPIAGLTPIPVDLNGNDRVSEDEKIFGDRASVIDRLSRISGKDVRNVPMEYIHFSVEKGTARPEAVAFIKWVVDNGLADIKDFGFLPAEPSRLKTF